MNEYGWRIIYDKTTGKVLYGVNCNSLGEMSGAVDNGLRPTEIDFIDLPFGSSILANAQTYRIDITKDKTTTPIEQLIIIDSTFTQPT